MLKICSDLPLRVTLKELDPRIGPGKPPRNLTLMVIDAE